MSKRVKFLLLLLLSLISVFFAEVISGSMKFPLFDLWGYFVVIPLYGLHTIILLYIINKYNKNKRILFSTLYFAGVLFGLYEAYITKVLWVGLSDDSFMFIHLSIIDFIVLVFFWHPLFSFIIPLLVFEKVMTNSDYLYQGLPEFFKKIISSKKGLLITFIVIGVFSAFNGVSVESLLLSLLAMSIPIIIIIYLLRRKGIHNKYSFSEILPDDKGIVYCFIYLAGIYLFMTFFVKFEVLTIWNQAVILINYILFGYLFYRKIRRNSKEENTLSNNTEMSFQSVVFYLIVIIVSGLLFVLMFFIFGIRDIFVVITWISWILLGLYFLVFSIMS